jgi:hypothetical protein
MSPWNLRGTYMETCNCDVACPCVFLSDPTQGECTVVIGWHIDKGRDGDVALDGLNVAMAVHVPGNMARVKWRAGVYIDDKASEAQHQSLLKIFGGQAGGHPAALASHVGEILGVTSARIDFDQRGKRVRLEIGDVAEAEIEQCEGQGSGPITVGGHPLAIAPGYPVTVAKSRKLSYSDHGMSWSEADRTAFFSPFAYEG